MPAPHSRRPRALRLGLLGGLSVALALGIAAAIPVLFGVPVRQIQVTWRTTDPFQREALERRFRLTESALVTGNRWSYVPADQRPETLRALVLDPAVESTNGVDRDTFAVSDRSPLTERRGGLIAPAPRAASQAAKLAMYVFGTLGAGWLLLSLLAARESTPRAAIEAAWVGLSEVVRWLGGVVARAGTGARALWAGCPPLAVIGVRVLAAAQRGVPVASAQAAGLFRLVFGSAVLLYVASHPVSSSYLTLYELPRAEGLYGSLVRWLAEHAAVVDHLDSVIPVLGALFVAGVATPISYAAFVAAVLVWASVATLGTSQHVVSSLSIALIALVPARWGDGLSVDAWLTRRAGGTAPSRRYGFTMWAPMFVFGVAFAAAAWSKLHEGPAWILNGTVKYHFITDFNQAFVPWGLDVTAYPRLAVFLSGAAVFIELLVVTAAFSRSSWYRAFWGAAALSMLTGFGLFQGLFWPGWWILLLGFLPWHRFRINGAPAGAGSLGVAQAAVVLAVVVQQLFASWARIEARPLMSAYDMYSTTYASPAAYEAASNLVYRVVGITASGTEDLPDCTIDEPAARSFALAVEGDERERVRIRSLIGECVEHRPDVVQVRIEGDKEVFDWEARRFAWKRQIARAGPVDASWLRESP